MDFRNSIQNLAFVFTMMLSMAGLSQAQSQAQVGKSVVSDNAVLVAATNAGNEVRFSALTIAKQIRLEVVSQSREIVYDSNYSPGNILEWQLRDQQGSELPDGLYACVITVEDLLGQVSQRTGIMQIQGGRALFQKSWQDRTQANASDPGENFTVLGTGEPLPITFVLNDASGGLIESGQGWLDFHAGDFFTATANRVPHMRLTPEGNLGIGVAVPKAKLDVAGLVKTSEGIQFSDGSILRMENGDVVLVRDAYSTAQDSSAILANSRTGAGGAGTTRILSIRGGKTANAVVNATGGTVNSIAKFVGETDLGDSALTEVGGKVGIGIVSPQATLDIQNAANTDTSLYLNTPGTESSQQASFNFITRSGANLGSAGSKGWQMYARGNAWGNASEQNDFGFSFWDGTTWNSAFALDSATGNLGIGTDSPKGKLSIQDINDTDTSIFLETPGTQRNQQSTMNFVTRGGASLGSPGTKGWTMYARGNAWRDAAEQNNFGFAYWDGTNWTPSMTMDSSSGNVGIGTPTPSSPLTVSGNVEVKGTGNGIIFPDGSALNSGSAARIRGINYLAGCETCGILLDTDDQPLIYINIVGAMTINSVTCFSDAGTPTINIQRDSGTLANVLGTDLACSSAGATSTNIVPGQSVLNLNDKLDFVMVSAGGTAKRVTIAIKATVNQ
jgi:hypothetical protein